MSVAIVPIAETELLASSSGNLTLSIVRRPIGVSMVISRWSGALVVITLASASATSSAPSFDMMSRAVWPTAGLMVAPAQVSAARLTNV